MTVHALPAPTAATYPALRERYLRDLTVAGTAERTLRAYRADLDDTAASLAAKQGVAVADLDLRAVTAPDLKDALAEFHSRRDARFTANAASAPATRARSTMRRRVSALRAFFAWAHGDGHLPTNPAVLLRPGMPAATQPRALSEPVARDVLAARAEGGSRWPERDLLVVALGACAGLRPGESAALALDALDPARPDAGLHVLGKGSRWRHLPVVPAPICVAAALYLPTRDARLRRLTRRAGTPPRAGTLLLSSRTRLDRHGVLTAEPTAEMVSYVVNAVLAEVLGERRRPGMGPHTLRHTFATLAALDGTGMRVLQELLGHADLSTTQRYVHVAADQLTAALTRHPLADAG